MADTYKHLYGPVPSRRLGLSLGVDIMPHKVCTLDCVYCQIGRTTNVTIDRKAYLPAGPILKELERKIAAGLEADFITMAGSGEPTLNSDLGVLIDGTKAMTDIPVTVLTNGTLLYRPDVRADCAKADVVLPSLDAGDEVTFQKMNRPHKDINIEMLVDGISTFRKEFDGQLWLEVFVVAPLNTDSEQVVKIGKYIERIQPDKIHLNTAVRPTAEPNIERLDISTLEAISAKLGPTCEIICDFSQIKESKAVNAGTQDVLAMLKRRPCSVEDISSGLGIHVNEVLKYITSLQNKGIIRCEQRNGHAVFMAN